MKKLTAKILYFITLIGLVCISGMFIPQNYSMFWFFVCVVIGAVGRIGYVELFED